MRVGITWGSFKYQEVFSGVENSHAWLFSAMPTLLLPRPPWILRDWLVLNPPLAKYLALISYSVPGSSQNSGVGKSRRLTNILPGFWITLVSRETFFLEGPHLTIQSELWSSLHPSQPCHTILLVFSSSQNNLIIYVSCLLFSSDQRRELVCLIHWCSLITIKGSVYSV